MRSDKDKKADPNRDIDNFLSRFDEMDNDSADVDSYLSESEESKSQVSSFQWKDIAPAKSSGKKKEKSERIVIKDPAPSAIKVQRLRPEEDEVPVYPVEDLKSDVDKPEAVEPEKASALEQIDDADKKSKGIIKRRRNKKKNKNIEQKLDESSTNEAPQDLKEDDASDITDELFSKDSATEAVNEDTENTTSAENTDNTDDSESIAATATEDKISAEILPFSLLNVPRKEKTPLASGDYILDENSGTYRKTDLGKRKRIEYKDTSSAGATHLTGRKKKEKKRKKARKSVKEVLLFKKNPNYRPDEGAAYELEGKIIKNKPLKFSFLKLIRNFLILGLILFLTGCGVAGYIIYHAPTYNFNDIYATVATSSIVYDDEGKQVDNIYYTENRRIVKYEDMPENLIESFVAIEDKTFWKHHGFNWTRMIGAVLSSITGHGQISGTSTITQQLSRNIYLPEEKSDRTIKRKLLEMYYAARIEHALSKEEIIEAYLNTIYLGYGCYGVNSASRTYFSKSVKDLSLLECAALAALPQAPHNYALLKNADEGGEVSEDSKVISKHPDKIVTNDISRERRNLTLDLMLEQGLISKEEYDESYDKAVNDFIKPTLSKESSNYAYFHEYLIDTIIADLEEQKGMSYEDAERTVYTGGLQIYSTLDSTAQNVIADEFKDDDNFPAISAVWRQDGDGNILNNDGEIALYDYDDYFDDNDNFRLSGEAGDIVFHEDGSATINKGHNLNIYETEVNGTTDYSIEFKEYYMLNEGILYSIQGGFVNIPSDYKSADDNGNVKVSADFFSNANYKESFKRDGNDLIISHTGYSIGRWVRQPQGAMVIVGVGTGEVKAMVGGRQFNGQKLLNRAVGARQPGSSIKPLTVYGAALQKSYELQKEGKKWEYTNYKIDRQGIRGYGDYITVHSSVEDERTKVNGKYWPKNASGGFSGTNNFRTAIQQSINTCAVKIILQVTPEYAIKQLEKFGITTAVDVEEDAKINDVNPAAMALGAMTEGVEPLEMALAYASFPAGGKLNSPICYTKVLDRNGKVLLEGKSVQTEALNEGVAWIMTDVLKSVVSRGIAWNADISEVDVGGKTGTTNDQYDVWFDGFTPSYAAALWIGTDNNVEMNEMSSAATRLWSTIMEQIPRAKEGEYREQPDNVIFYYGDYYTKGTEVGLSSWSYAAEKKKAREAAYKKWLTEREKHKKTVPYTEERVLDKDISESEVETYKRWGWTVTLKETKPDGTKIYHAHRVDKIQRTREEYEPGWRDGDFCYTFDGKQYCD